jgi:dTDP-4-amino-4,6-dideoxygalactose transaminase
MRSRPDVPVAAPNRLGPDESVAVHEAIDRVVRNGPWILGDRVAAFEAAWAAYAGHPEVVGVGNGTDALVLAFTSLGLSPGADVLVAAVEGGYAATAARLAGLVPRVLDVDPQTMGPTVEVVAAAHGPGVEAIVVTHLHGDAVPLADLDRWRRRHGLALVEDCAQAHGLRVDGRHVGTTGDAATYSFYPTKNLGAVGDGGAVAFADAAHAAKATRLRQYGWGERFRVETPGGRNSRLDTVQAAVLSARLPFLDERNARRRDIANRYRHLVSVHGDAATTVAHHSVALVDDRDALRERLHAAGVRTEVHYPYLLQEMPGLGLGPVSTPAASAVRDRILSLPCFPELTDDEVERVCAALRVVDQ